VSGDGKNAGGEVAVLPLLKRDPLPKKRDPIETHILTK